MPLRGGLGGIPLTAVAVTLLLLASGSAQAATGSAWEWTTVAGPLECEAESDRIVEGTELWVKCASTKTFGGATVDFDVVWTQLGAYGTGYRFNTRRLTFVEGTKANHERAFKIFIPDDGVPEKSGKILKLWAKMSFKIGTVSVFGVPLWTAVEEAIFYKTLYVDDDDDEIVISTGQAVPQEGRTSTVELKARLASGDTPPSGFKVDVDIGASGDSATEGTDYSAIPNQTLTFSGSSADATKAVTFSPKANDGLDFDETVSVFGKVVTASVPSGYDYLAPKIRNTEIQIEDPGSRHLTLKLSVPADTKQRAPMTSIEVCESGSTRDANGNCTGGTGVTARVTVTATEGYTKERKVLVKVGGKHGDTAVSGTHFNDVADFEVTIAKNSLSGTKDFNFRPTDNSTIGSSTFLTVHGQETGPDSLNGVVSSAKVNIADNDANRHNYDLPRAPLEIVEGNSGSATDFAVAIEFDSNSADGVNRGLTCAWQYNYAFVSSGVSLPSLSNRATPTSDNAQSPGDYLQSTGLGAKVGKGAKSTVKHQRMSGTIYGDNLYEGDEAFYAYIVGHKCQNSIETEPLARHMDSDYRLIVIKDDDKPDIRLSTSVNALNEDTGKQTVTVTATTELTPGGSGSRTIFSEDQTITVAVGHVNDTATEGTDYKAVADLTITIAKGKTSGTATFDFEPIDDTQTERENISIIGTSSTLPSSAYIYNTDIDLGDYDWPISLTLKPSTLTESGGLQNVLITAEGPGVPPLTDILLKFVVGKKADSAEAGSDYTALSEQYVGNMNLRFSARRKETKKTRAFDLTVIDDSVDEGDDDTEFEEITISGIASAPSLANPSQISANEMLVSSTKLAIKDDDTADFSISVSPASVAEGTDSDEVDSESHTMTVTVTANTAAATATTVAVDVGLSSDSATSGTDYTAVPSFDITVPAKKESATGTFTFTPTDDTDFEGTETVTVHGSSGNFDISSGTFDITEDDLPVVDLAVTPDKVDEDASQPTVTVGAKWDGSYTWDTDMTITVSFGEDTDTAVGGATCASGVDYKSVSDLKLTIPAGDKGQTKSFIFNPCDDDLDEGSEYLTLSGSGTGMRFKTDDTQLYIRDDDRLSIELSIDPLNFSEATENTTVTVSAEATGLGTGGSVAAASTGRKIDLELKLGADDDTASYGVDYAKVSVAKLTFNKDETKTTTFVFSPTDDSLIEGTETFSLVGSTTVGTSQEAAMAAAASRGRGAAGRFSAAGTTTVDVNTPQGQLKDNDLPDPSLSVSPSSVNEDDDTQTVTVTMNDPKTSEVDVEYTISISSGSSATPSTDFATVSDFKLTIPKNGTSGSATFDLTPTNDTLVEGDEKIIVEIDHETLVANAQVTLADDDTGAMALSVSPSSVTEDAGKTSVAVTVATDGDTFSDERVVTVAVGESGDTAVEGTDYQTVADLTLKIPVGSTSASKSFDFTPNDDYVAGDTQSATVSGTSTGDYTVSDAALSITDNDVIGAVLNPTSLTLGETSDDRTGTYTVKLSSQPTGDVTVTLASADSTVATVKPKSLSFTSSTWNTAQTVTVTAVDDLIDNAEDRSTNVTHTFSGADYGNLEAENLSRHSLRRRHGGLGHYYG